MKKKKQIKLKKIKAYNNATQNEMNGRTNERMCEIGIIYGGGCCCCCNRSC